MSKFVVLGYLSFALLACSGLDAQAQKGPRLVVPGGKNVSCAAFMRLSPSQAREVLYFANGYAAGVEDQISSGTPDAVPPGTNPKQLNPNASSPVSSSLDLSGLSTLGMDELRTVCEAEPSVKVLSVIPGGQPVTGSGYITPSASSTSSDGGSDAAPAAVSDTTGSLSVSAPGDSALGAAEEVLSAPTATTTQGSVASKGGIVTAKAGSTMLPLGSVSASTISAPTAGSPVGGELSSPGASPGTLSTGGGFGGTTTGGSTP